VREPIQGDHAQEADQESQQMAKQENIPLVGEPSSASRATAGGLEGSAMVRDRCSQRVRAGGAPRPSPARAKALGKCFTVTAP